MTSLNIAVPPHVVASRLWFGTCTGAAAWILHGVLCVFIATHFCNTGYPSATTNAPLTARALLMVVTFLALGVTAAAGWVSFQNWSQTNKGKKDWALSEAIDREAFMALIGIVLNVILALGILCAGLPIVLLDLCARTR